MKRGKTDTEVNLPQQYFRPESQMWLTVEREQI